MVYRDLDYIDELEEYLVPGARLIRNRSELAKNVSDEDKFEIEYDFHHNNFDIKCDKLGRIGKVTYLANSDGEVHETLFFKYDNKGLLIEFKRYFGKSETPDLVSGISYDNRGRVRQKKQLGKNLWGDYDVILVNFSYNKKEIKQEVNDVTVPVEVNIETHEFNDSNKLVKVKYYDKDRRMIATRQLEYLNENGPITSNLVYKHDGTLVSEIRHTYNEREDPLSYLFNQINIVLDWNYRYDDKVHWHIRQDYLKDKHIQAV